MGVESEQISVDWYLMRSRNILKSASFSFLYGNCRQMYLSLVDPTKVEEEDQVYDTKVALVLDEVSFCDFWNLKFY